MAKLKSQHKKSLKFSTVLFILLLVAAITFFVLALLTPVKNTTTDEAEPEATTTKTTSKESDNDNTSTTEEETTTTSGETTESGKNTKQYEGTVEKSNNIAVTITRNEVNNKKYTLRVTMNEQLSENATCSLVMKSGKNEINRTSEIVNSADSSSCYGFDFDTDGLASGTYNFTITVKSGSRTGSASGKITI